MRSSHCATGLLVVVALSCSDGQGPASSPAASAGVDAIGDLAAVTTADSAGGLETTAAEATAQVTCPGGAHCPCDKDDDCEQQACWPSATSPSGKACAARCGDGCPPGDVCENKQIGPDSIGFCAHGFARLCDPCQVNADCAVPGAKGGCLDTGVGGRFCGVACATDSFCPAGYRCLSSDTADGSAGLYCVPSVEGAAGQCVCSTAAAALQKQTSCAALAKDSQGKVLAVCSGTRQCPQGGGVIGNCTAKQPAAEVCNGKDDDCDGKTDEEACGDGVECTVDTCLPGGGAGVCSHDGQAALCPDDGNPCTSAVCDASSGCSVKAVAGAACDDGNGCTLGDNCGSGGCGGGKPKNCDDGSACTTDGCAPATGMCTNLPSPLCDDGNPCTTDSCAAASGCVHANNTGPCDDGNSCTTKDSCGGGQCIGGPLAAGCNCAKASDCEMLEDGLQCNGTLYCAQGLCKLNPASVVQCDNSGAPPCYVNGCQEPIVGSKAATCKLVPASDGTPCQDGVALTDGDVCSQGLCKGTFVGVCTATADCGKFEDGNLCNGTLFCNKATGKCAVLPSTIKHCSSADDTVCHTNQCQPATGLCKVVAVAEGLACDDGNPCTTGTACSNGQCAPTTGGTATCPCSSDGDCAKLGDACSGAWFCNKASKTCQANPALQVVCSDVGDSVCSKTKCDPLDGKCKPAPVANGTPCDADSSACTVADSCQSGVCVAGTAICECAQDGECAPFDNGNLCDGTLYCDKAKGVCFPNPKGKVVCNVAADNACAVNQCMPASGQCVLTPVNAGGACSDGNPCTEGDVCGEGKCKPGVNGCGACKGDQDCPSDGNPCNGIEFCDTAAAVPACAGKGAIAQGGNCNDGDGCTVADNCTLNVCVGLAKDCGDNELCTSDACKDGQCVNLAQSGTCSDGDACTLGDACLSKQCKPGSGKLDCSDGNPCTTDSCGSASGCGHVANSDPCSDGNACTVGEACGGGTCGGGIGLNCADGNSCTNDSCDAVKGCVALANTATCTDSNACTVEACSGGKCAVKGPVTCDDGNTCTTDVCDNGSGCKKVPITGGACSDGNACTNNDTCSAGACKGNSAQCFDGKGCTDDSCNPASGCVYSPNSAACSDGNACTSGDVCKLGFCAPGAATNCNDNNSCTNDSCSTSAGCQHTVVAGAGNKLCTDGVVLAGRCFKAFKVSKNWTDAQAACQSFGGTLASAASQAENDAMRSAANVYCPAADAWIGLTDSATEGSWKWVDGAAYGYTNWKSGEPNNAGGGEDWVLFNGNGKWLDYANAAIGCYVCERAMGVPCDDGNKCTKNDACELNAACVGTVLSPCP